MRHKTIVEDIDNKNYTNNATTRRRFLSVGAAIPFLFVVTPDGRRVDAASLTDGDTRPVGIRYRDGVIERIKLVRETNRDLLDEIGRIGYETIRAGNKCYAYMHAGHTHNMDNYEGRVGLPKIFIPVQQSQKLDMIRAGDLLVCSSGDNPEMPEVIRAKKATLVSWTFPYGGDAHNLFEKMIPDRAKRLYDVRLGQFTGNMIETYQDTEEGTLEIPGIRAKFGAQSGPLVMSMFWMITLRIAERLADAGVEVEVSG